MATNPAKILRVARTCRDAARHYRAPLPAVLARVTRLKLIEKFRPKESFLWGIADPSKGRDTIGRYVSRGRLYRLQARHNPMSLTYLTEDKAVFYAYCQGAGLTVPTLHGVYHRQGGWVAGPRARRLAERREWLDYLREEAPSPLVIKPSKGVYARGLQVLTRQPGGAQSGSAWRSAAGDLESAEALLDALDGDRDYESFVLQSKLVNDPALLELSGSGALQTVRVVTWVDSERVPRVLFACFKVINSEHLSDNFDYGSSGNLLADVDLATGRLRQVQGKHPSGFGLQELEAHPATGIRFSEVELPHWRETLELAEHAALAFMPLRTIGWDIGITAEGPSIVEGNVWWDALHNAHQRMPRYLETFG
ncbi:MAG: sugar-transfer associated ATP-grasp domain-containing protein [Acidobacteriota bacterium]